MQLFVFVSAADTANQLGTEIPMKSGIDYTEKSFFSLSLQGRQPKLAREWQS